jgi:protein SCO1/2
MPRMNTPPTRRPVAALLVIAAVAALLLGLWVGQQRWTTPEPVVTRSATLLPQPRPLTDFALVDHHGEPFTLSRLQGAWTFMFFGYTFCPDICPTTMVMLNSVMKRLATQPDIQRDTRVVFISVDPERDTPARLAEYVPHFNADFLGVSGPASALPGLTGQLGILYQRNIAPEGESEAGYLVDHTASILLLDPRGRWTAIFSAPHNAEAIAEDYLAIRKHH